VPDNWPMLTDPLRKFEKYLMIFDFNISQLDLFYFKEIKCFLLYNLRPDTYDDHPFIGIPAFSQRYEHKIAFLSIYFEFLCKTYQQNKSDDIQYQIALADRAISHLLIET
jgi:hypothetical protein